jgi:hypothetical protein
MIASQTCERLERLVLDLQDTCGGHGIDRSLLPPPLCHDPTVVRDGAVFGATVLGGALASRLIS